MSIEKRFFGKTSDDRDVYLFTVKNSSGANAKIITYGGTLQSLFVPDKTGELKDVLIGFDDIEGHEKRSDYQGQLVGRYANRLAGGIMSVNGTKYEVTRNEKGETCLHGGGEFSHAVWAAEIIGENVLKLMYDSTDGANGFPGNMHTEAVYTLTESNELIINYTAVCDKDTAINLTNHAYFNLGGFRNGDILDHELMINADYYTPTDLKSIPTGEKRAVKGTAFDFTSPKAIGLEIGANDEQLINCKGYDHNFCLNDRTQDEPAAQAYSPSTGIAMDVYTDMPGVQLYTGNFLDGTEGKSGIRMNKHAGFCLETQYYPDTPNQPSFPQCTFAAGEEFKSRTSFKFSVR